MQKEDLDFIKKIIKLSDSVYRLYNKLINLEIEEKKESYEYKKILSYLEIAIDIENKAYINSNPSVLKYHNYYVLIKLKLKEYDFENILDLNYSNIVIERVLDRVSNILNQLEIQNDNLKLNKSINKKEINSLNTLEQYSYTARILLDNELKKDLLTTFLYFLDLEIKQKQNKKIKDNLLRAKYNIIFNNNQIEKYIIKSKFNLENKLYVGAKLITDLFGIGNENYNSIKDSYYCELIAQQTNKLLKIDDIDFNDINKATSAILKKIFIKSSLLLLNNNSVDEMEEVMNNYINNKDLSLNNISVNITKNAYNIKETDKEKILAVSFKQNNQGTRQ